MPKAPAKACAVYGCPNDQPCADHSRVDERNAFQRGYDKRWQRLSREHLRKHPLCGDRAEGAPVTTDSQCRAAGRIVAANVTDHIQPHRGNERLRLDQRNFQSLCFSCHGSKSAHERSQR